MKIAVAWKQSPRGVLLKRCSQNFLKIHRKMPALKFLFNKVVGLRAYNVIKKWF